MEKIFIYISVQSETQLDQYIKEVGGIHFHLAKKFKDLTFPTNSVNKQT